MAGKEKQFTDMSLRALFENDPRLSKTIPKSYELDQEKVQKWNEIQTVSHPMSVVKVSFYDLLAGLEKGFEHCLKMMRRGVHFLCSNGQEAHSEGSASEKWLFYAAKLYFTNHGMMSHPHWDGFERFFLDGTAETDLRFLFIDDFVNSGCHIIQRILSAEDLFFGGYQCPIVQIVVGAADKDFQFDSLMFSDLMGEYSPPRNFHLGQIDLFVGHQIERGFGDRLFLEHKCLENMYDDLYCGFAGKQTLGSLIAGWVPTKYQYPPALYHLEFGKGELPQWSPPYMEIFFDVGNENPFIRTKYKLTMEKIVDDDGTVSMELDIVCPTVKYPGNFQDAVLHLEQTRFQRYDVQQLLSYSNIADAVWSQRSKLATFLEDCDGDKVSARLNQIVYDLWEELGDSNERMASYLDCELSLIEEFCGSPLSETNCFNVENFAKRTSMIRHHFSLILEGALFEI